MADVVAHRILVVDDNADSCQTLAALLIAMGHEAQWVIDPRQALEIALSFRPSIAFLDLGMPHLDGWALARQLRLHFSRDILILVALTGWNDDAGRRKSRQAGFDAHLAKPADPLLLKSIFATL